MGARVSKLRIGVIYGGRSVEHEVSVVTALQAMEALNPERYEIVPLYITKQGEWFTGAALRKLATYEANSDARRTLTRVSIAPFSNGGVLQVAERSRLLPLGGPARIVVDVVMPCIHGTFGEDGTLQGLLELADLPYVGSGVLGSAVGMDKIAMKALFRSVDLPIVDCSVIRRAEWEKQPEQVVERIERSVGYPAFVKPANLGSSVGITKATDQTSLRDALDVASRYDVRMLVERAIEGAIDVNCSVLGYADDLRVSVCEQPVAWESFLSYEDKYIRGGKGQGMKGTSRRIPAPIPAALTEQIQSLARRAFQVIDAAGVARIDFLVTPDGTAYVNEINTTPGSLSFYLWEATDLPFPRLLDRLVEIAQLRHADRQQTSYSFDSDLIMKTLAGAGKGRR